MLNAAQTPVTVANQVSMLRASMKGVILLVEGDLDVRLYRRFALPIPHSRTILCQGKPVLLEAMDILAGRRVRGVLGVCDADFDRILGIAAPANIAYTDFHDSEVMIACSEALALVVGEVMGSLMPSEIVPTKRDLLMGFAASVGRVRIWSKETEAHLTFRGIDAGSFLSSGAFDLDGYCSAVLDNGPSAGYDLASLLEVARNHRSQAEITELAVGHDFVSLLDAHIAIERAESRMGSRVLGSMMRLAFDSACFRKTNLCRAIVAWEEETGFDVVADDARWD